MKNIIFSILVFGLMTIACNKTIEKTYPLEVSTIDNIMHVGNPQFPKSGITKYVLKEELSIGNETDDNYLFSKVRKIVVDNQGNIYVPDSSRCRVQVFDANGKYLRTIGKKGEGPGEQRFILDMITDDDNKKIHILDSRNRKISRYHFDGSFDSDIKLHEGSPEKIFPAQNGSYIVLYSYQDDNQETNFKLIKYADDGMIEMQINDFISTINRTKHKGGMVVTFKTHFDPKNYFLCDTQGNLYYGFSQTYEIAIYDKEFNKAMVIKRNVPIREAISEKEKDEVRSTLKEQARKKGVEIQSNMIKFPRYHPVFSGIWLDDKGRILVHTYSNDDKVHLDVFNNGGIYIDKMIIDAPGDGTSLGWIFYCPVFKHGYIYSVVQNSDGILVIKKYSLKKI